MTNTPLRPKIGLAVFTALLMLGLCELAARGFLPAPPNGTRQPEIVYRYDPEIRYVHVPNQQGWIDDGLVSINSLGFRGREVVVPKPTGRFRVVVLGDSVALGWGVGDHETFSFQLEQLLHKRFPNRDLDVINLAVAGYNTRQEVTLFKRYVTRLEPDLVLVGFYTNDVPDAAEDKGPAAGTRILATNPEAGQVLHLNPTPSSWLDRQLRRSRVIYMVGRAVRQLMGNGDGGKSGFAMELDVLQGKDSAALDRAWGTVQTELGDLQALARVDGFSAGIVVLPCREQVLGQYPNARYQNRIRTIAQPLGFFVIDPLQRLASDTRQAALFIPYDRNHPSAAGHRIIAQAIFHDLEAREPLAARGVDSRDTAGFVPSQSPVTLDASSR
jgi:lysophospholipase L1-like esterase